ncbi:hypothetical protein I4F81_001251 [Pyropia yezoensis]|uniref:Uncharacterized protein n=1 Tax=Pyropia yezoensis TaxID=2788 RepID=A0ACC3BLM7_PYRYE|nr:hypothetical protein I4F81_001251 [Neopyropia yezoensis]|eukprot:contig_13787_g3316
MSPPTAPCSAPVLPTDPSLCFAFTPPTGAGRPLSPPTLAAVSRFPPAAASAGSFVAHQRSGGVRSMAGPSSGPLAVQLQRPPSPERRGVTAPPADLERPPATVPTAAQTPTVGDADGRRRRSPIGSSSASPRSAADASWQREQQAVAARAAAEASSASSGRRPEVEISKTAWNKRGIRAGILIRASLPTVWSALTDYSRLSTFIPNLAFSKQRYHPSGGIRLEQWGVQRIVGFQFKAAVVLDMTEVGAKDPKERAIDFTLASSRDFAEFFGTWRLSSVEGGGTWLDYDVNIQPKGLVPVKAVEWRIKEDVPSNLMAVRSYCELLDRRSAAAEMRLSAENQSTQNNTGTNA